jgi:hypothetical protein
VSRSRRSLDEILKSLLLRAFLKAGQEEITQEKIDSAFQKAAEAASETMAHALREGKRSMLIEHASIRRGFEVRLRDIWGEALDAAG